MLLLLRFAAHFLPADATDLFFKSNSVENTIGAQRYKDINFFAVFAPKDLFIPGSY